MQWKWHNNPTMMTVWVHLLMLAEYEQRECEGVTLKRGECLVSQQWLAEFVGISERMLRTCLERLAETGEIEKKKTWRRTLIVIKKYDEYQSVARRAETATTTTATTTTAPAAPESDDIQKNNITNKNLTDRSELEKEKMAYALRMSNDEGWKAKCVNEGVFPAVNYCGYIIGFCEYQRQTSPTKRWLSYQDFCMHFYSWSRLVKRETARKYCLQAYERKRQEEARRIEEERQEQMWRDIEEAKRKAVPYQGSTPS